MMTDVLRIIWCLPNARQRFLQSLWRPDRGLRKTAKLLRGSVTQTTVVLSFSNPLSSLITLGHQDYDLRGAKRQ